MEWSRMSYLSEKMTAGRSCLLISRCQELVERVAARGQGGAVCSLCAYLEVHCFDSFDRGTNTNNAITAADNIQASS